MGLKQLNKLTQREEVIKKSTFIAIVAPATSVEKAMLFIDKYSQNNVTHNCWAYKVGQNYRFNDDGEPSGTAGMPILKAIEGQGFDNTAALVIRHYGGIKLGTGGLMRAYGGTVNRCLQEADFSIIQDLDIIILSVQFQYIQSIYNLVNKFDAEVISEEFNESGAVISVELLNSSKNKFVKESTNVCKGTIKFIKKRIID